MPTEVRLLVPKRTLVMAEALSDFQEIPTSIRRSEPVGATLETVTLPLATLLVRVVTKDTPAGAGTARMADWEVVVSAGDTSAGETRSRIPVVSLSAPSVLR